MNIVLNSDFNSFEHGQPELITSLEAFYELSVGDDETSTVVEYQVKSSQEDSEDAKKFSKSIFELNQTYLRKVTKPTSRVQFDAVIQKYLDVIPKHLCKEILGLKYASNKKDFTNYVHMRKLKLSETMIATILSTKFLS